MIVQRVSTLSLLPTYIYIALQMGHERGAPLSITITIIDTRLRPYLEQSTQFLYLYCRELTLASQPFSQDSHLCTLEQRPIVERYWRVVAKHGYSLHVKFGAALHQLFRRLIREQRMGDGSETLEIDLRSLSRVGLAALKKMDRFKTALSDRFRSESAKQSQALQTMLASPEDRSVREYWHLQFEWRAPAYLRMGCWRQATALLELIHESEALLGPNRLAEMIQLHRIPPTRHEAALHAELREFHRVHL